MIQILAQFCPQNHPCPVVQICPVGAVKQEGFAAPTVDKDLCTECGICTMSCAAFQDVEDSAA